MTQVESLLSARLFLVPQLADNRLYFLSNISGHNSLYAMDYGGSVPEPLLPPAIALQNPHLIDGLSFKVFPHLGQILVMIDQDGDENYQPMLIPLDGGYPVPAFSGFFSNYRVHLVDVDLEKGIAYFNAESRERAVTESYQGNLTTGELIKMGESTWGVFPSGYDPSHSKAILIDSYSAGDHVLYYWERGIEVPRLIYGIPLETRDEGQEVPANAIFDISMVQDGKGILFVSALFEDTYSLGYMDLANPEVVLPVAEMGKVHQGMGELVSLKELSPNHYLIGYNIDGVSWFYEGTFDLDKFVMQYDHVICGEGILSNGVVESISYDKGSNRYAVSFSTATTPTQLYTVEGKDRKTIVAHTREKALGIPASRMSPGEALSFTSFDGVRVSARLYLPADELGFEGPRPLVYYVHGGPQGQERPDFTWFSMPLIQFLTMKGFAVFVPNVRGSTGYGVRYMKHVDRDWGGQDRLDHVHAMSILADDPRLDISRSGVVGRSYGGYMSLTLASRHPELWSAAVDMFGPFDLLTFIDRIPVTWKPYFAVAVGDKDKDHDFLVERSPKTYIDQIQCPLLVIQGKNDPRVVEPESHDLVEHLRGQGKPVEYLVFPNEGHDVLKFENKVRCYNAITEFFIETLKP